MKTDSFLKNAFEAQKKNLLQFFYILNCICVSLIFSSCSEVLTTGTVDRLTAASIAKRVPSKLVFVAQPSYGSANVIFPTQPIVEVQDDFGRPVPASTALISFAIGTNPSAGHLAGTTSINASSGRANFTNLAIDNPGSGYTLVASSAGLTSAVSGAFVVNSGTLSAASSTISVSPTSITADGTTSSSVTINIKDSLGYPVMGQSVTIAASGSGNLIIQPTLLTNSLGQTFASITSTGAGAKSVSIATPVALSSVTSSLTVVAGAPVLSQSTLVASPTSVGAGSSTSTISLTLKDQFGNPVSGVSTSIAVSGTGNTITNVTPTTTAAGVATFTVSSTVAATKTISISSCGTPCTTNLSGLTTALTVTGPSVSISNPTTTSYSNASNSSAFTASGTCSANGQAVSLSATDGTSTATGSATCSAGAWSTSTLNLSTLSDGAVTLTAQHSDAYGNSSNSSVAFKKDTVLPALTASSFVINSGATTITSPNLGISIAATDATSLGSGISAIGFVTQSTSCTSDYSGVAWQTYNAANSYNFVTSYTNGSKTICAWAKDNAGNVSAMTSTTGKDIQAITVNLGAPPVFNSLVVTNANASSSNFGTNIFSSGDLMKITFTLTSTNALATNPVEVYYSTSSNPTTWTLLSAANVVGSPGTGQTAWSYSYTGASAPSSGYFILKLTASDIYQNAAAVLSTGSNTGNWSQYAGNTSNGLNLTATSARIQAQETDFGKNQVGVNSTGKIFLSTFNLGLATVLPSTGIISTYLRFGSLAGVPGTITTSTAIPMAYNIWMDGDNLYLLSSNGTIYLINTLTNYISVYAGGGTQGCGIGNSLPSCSGFSPTSLYVWSFGTMTMDPISKDMYIVNTCDPAVTASGTSAASIKIQKISQTAGVATAVSDVAGNCALSAAPSSGSALGVSIFNSGNVWRSTTSSLVYVPSTGSLYFASESSSLMKIKSGNLYYSSGVGSTGSIYIASQNAVYTSGANGIYKFTPTASASFDETPTLYIQPESSCSASTCRADGIAVGSAGVSAKSLFTMGGQLGFIDNSDNTANIARYRILSPGAPITVQTFAGTDRFSGGGGLANVAFFSKVNKILYKTTSADSSGFSSGLYAQDTGAAMLLYVNPSNQLISVAAGSGISKKPTNGTGFSSTNPLAAVYSSHLGFNNLALDPTGYFTFFSRGTLVDTASGAINYFLSSGENSSTDILAQANGYSGTAMGFQDGEGLDGFAYDSTGNLFVGGYNPSYGNPNKIMVRSTTGRYYTVIGASGNSVSPDCATSGCAATSSIYQIGNSDAAGFANYIGAIDNNFNSNQGRLLFTENTKIRYITAPASVTSGTSTSTLQTLVDFGSQTPGAFVYNYTDATNTQINEIFYVSGTNSQLYCYRVASGTDSNCSSTAPGTNLGPTFTTLSTKTLAMDNSGNVYALGVNSNTIYKYTIPAVNNAAGTVLENFSTTTAGYVVDNTAVGSFVATATGTDGAGNNTGTAGQITYSFPSSSFTYDTASNWTGYTGSSCSGWINRACVAALRAAPSGLQAQSLSLWIKSTSSISLYFRVLDSNGTFFDYPLNSLDRIAATGNAACSGCTNGWYKYVVDLGAPAFTGTSAGMSAPTYPNTAPTFTQLGGTTTIAKFGLVVFPAGQPWGNNYTADTSGSVIFDLVSIADAALITPLSQTPITRTTSAVNVLTAPASVQPNYQSDYLSQFGICSHTGDVAASTGYTWPSPLIDAGWTYPNLIQNAGFKQIRADVSWAGVEQTAGVYSFTHLDSRIAKAETAGLSIWAILDYNNTFYASSATQGVLAGSDMNAWKNYVNATVSHYSGLYGTGFKYEVWNEPDLYTWPGANTNSVSGQDDGSLYGNLLLNTTAQIAATATANSFASPFVASAGVGGFKYNFINTFMAAGNANAVSAISYHPYTYPYIPENFVDAHSAMVSMVKNSFTSRSLTAPPIYATELGYASSMYDRYGNPVGCNTPGSGCSASSNGLSNGGREFQALYIVRSLLIHFAEGIHDILYELTDTSSIYSGGTCTNNTSGACNNNPQIYQWQEANFGLLESAYYGNNSLGTGALSGFGFAPKPAYWAVKTFNSFLTSILGSSNSANSPVYDGMVSLSLSSAFAMRFHDNNHKYLIVWGADQSTSYKLYLPSTPSAALSSCGSHPTNGAFDNCSSDSSQYVTPIGTDAAGTFVRVDRHPVYLTF